MARGSRIADLTASLGTWGAAQPPALTWALPEMRALLRADFAGAYRVHATDTGWSLDFMLGAGPRAARLVGVYRDLVARHPRSDQFFGYYDPVVIPERERNRPMLLSDLARLEKRPKVAERPSWYASLYGELGLDGHDQLRVLLCRGPSLLAWIGASSPEPFTRREVSILRRLTKPLHRRLLLEQEVLAPGLSAAALDVALEALGRAAFVTSPKGRVAFANRAGTAMLEHDRRSVAELLRASDAGRGPFEITPIRVEGWPDYRLAVLRERAPSIATRLHHARRRWELTPAQARVLEELAAGSTNKEIAGALACAEVTVENHVTALLRRSKTRSRVHLLRKLFGQD